jgi:glutamine amidotransferase
MFMHNGEVAQFNKIKRKVQSFLEDRFFLLPMGSTDSEWCFSLFLQHLSNLGEDVDSSSSFDYKILQKATLQTIDSLNKWAEEAGITEPSLLNFVVTDGKSIIATRYISSVTSEAASLWFSTGTVSRVHLSSTFSLVLTYCHRSHSNNIKKVVTIGCAKTISARI